MAFLSPERQEHITNVIQNVLLDTGFTFPGDDLTKFAESLGIKVYEIDIENLKFSEKENYGYINGFVKYPGEENPKVYINKHYSPQRKYFTLAHELGHILLKHGGEAQFRVDGFDYRANNEEAYQETEANYFAASLLVPKDSLTYALRQGWSTSKIAEKFNVSQSVIENRIAWLEQNDTYVR